MPSCSPTAPARPFSATPACSPTAPGGGYEPLRAWLGARHGVDAGRVIVTNGGLQGFVFYAEELLAERPGRVLVEAPTYDRPLKILARLGAEVVPVAMDDEGPRPGRARARARRGRDELPLHDPDLPEPERADALDRAAAARRRACRVRTACRCSRTTRTASSATRASRRRRCTSSRAASSSRTRPRSRRPSRPACGSAGSSLPRSCAARIEARAVSNVHLAALPHPGDGLRADRPWRVRAEPGADPRALEDAPRRDARGARARARRRGDLERARGRLLHLGRLPADAADLLARAEAAGVTFVKGEDFYPRRAASGFRRRRAIGVRFCGCRSSCAQKAARLAFSYASPSEIGSGVSTLASLLRA